MGKNWNSLEKTTRFTTIKSRARLPPCKSPKKLKKICTTEWSAVAKFRCAFPKRNTLFDEGSQPAHGLLQVLQRQETGGLHEERPGRTFRRILRRGDDDDVSPIHGR